MKCSVQRLSVCILFILPVSSIDFCEGSLLAPLSDIYLHSSIRSRVNSRYVCAAGISGRINLDALPRVYPTKKRRLVSIKAACQSGIITLS